MSSWPPVDKKSVYVPPAISAPPVSGVEHRAQIAAARVREGLSVSDEILSEILASPYSASDVGIFTPAERATSTAITIAWSAPGWCLVEIQQP